MGDCFVTLRAQPRALFLKDVILDVASFIENAIITGSGDTPEVQTTTDRTKSTVRDKANFELKMCVGEKNPNPLFFPSSNNCAQKT